MPMFSSFHAYVFINSCLPFDEKPAYFHKKPAYFERLCISLLSIEQGFQNLQSTDLIEIRQMQLIVLKNQM